VPETTVIAVPTGPEEAERVIASVTARAGVAGMASMKRERITASVNIWKTLLYFIFYLHYVLPGIVMSITNLYYSRKRKKLKRGLYKIPPLLR
jgi:hypothetical protein